MDNERLIGLIAYLHAHHAGGFLNNTIQRDELLSVLQELRALRNGARADVGKSVPAAAELAL
jgi:hypothetical protein